MPELDSLRASEEKGTLPGNCKLTSKWNEHIPLHSFHSEHMACRCHLSTVSILTLATDTTYTSSVALSASATRNHVEHVTYLDSSSTLESVTASSPRFQRPFRPCRREAAIFGVMEKGKTFGEFRVAVLMNRGSLPWGN